MGWEGVRGLGFEDPHIKLNILVNSKPFHTLLSFLSITGVSGMCYQIDFVKGSHNSLYLPW